MHSHEAAPLEQLREAVIVTLPEFETSTFSVLNAGWDSVAVDVDGAWIFKFPRHVEAADRLRRECRILALIRPRLQLAVPEMVLHEAPTLFSQHRKLPGGFLLSPDYHRLAERQRDAIAEQMAGLYAALHAIPKAEVRAAGATRINPWINAVDVPASAARLPDDLRPYLATALAAFAAIPADPGEVYGYFDGHGWNMAFDPESGVLNGVYDFADSGFGGRHEDLSFGNWIARDLTRRTIDRYEKITGLSIDRARVDLYSEVLRFIEFADTQPDSDEIPARLLALREWFGGGP